VLRHDREKGDVDPVGARECSAEFAPHSATFHRHFSGQLPKTFAPGCQANSRPLSLEQLEDRLVPTSFPNVSSVSQLIADITAAHGGANTITLVAGDTFTLTKVNNRWSHRVQRRG